MAKLSKLDWDRHEKAQKLLDSGEPLNEVQKDDIFDYWSPLARHRTDVAGIYFTPIEAAQALAYYVPDGSVLIDPCAGIGRLLWEVKRRQKGWPRKEQCKRMIAIEIETEFYEIGKRLMPEVEWYCGNMLDLDLWRQIGPVDFMIANPPFGRVKTIQDKKMKSWLTYQGVAELMLAEVCLRVSKNGGIFIWPRMTAPWETDDRGRVNFKTHVATTLRTWRTLFPKDQVSVDPSELPVPDEDVSFAGAQAQVEFVVLDWAYSSHERSLELMKETFDHQPTLF